MLPYGGCGCLVFPFRRPDGPWTGSSGVSDGRILNIWVEVEVEVETGGHVTEETNKEVIQTDK